MRGRVRQCLGRSAFDALEHRELTFLREGEVNLVASLQTFNELGVLEGKAHRHGRPLQGGNGFMLNRDLAVGCIN